MSAPNVVAVATITGKTSVLAITTSATAIVTNTAGSGKVIKVNVLYVANIDGVNAADITVDLYRSTTAYKLANTIAVPADATVVAISKDTAIYLEEGDALRLTASANDDLQGIVSYEEIS